MENHYSFLYRWRKIILVIFIVMWITAFIATHIPRQYIPKEVTALGGFTLHAIGFLGLSSWFILTVVAFGISLKRRVLLVLFVMMVYAALDEYTQQFFGRSTDLADWITDTSATVVAIILWENILWLVRRRTCQKTK